MAMTPDSMAEKIKIELINIGYSPNADIPQKVILAICTGIINEIVTNSTIIPITTDQGTAGAGIITGKVA